MKKVIFGLFIMALSIVFSIVIKAGKCNYGIPAPKIFQIYMHYDEYASKLKTDENVCKGSNTAVYFADFKQFPSWYTDGNIWGNLYEEDPPGNDDEYVKEYVMFVSGRKITSVSLVKVYNSGNIDSVGDQTCELKMGYYASGNVGGNILPENLFKYTLCMTR